MNIQESKKSMSLRNTDKIVIRKVINPITKKYSFSVVNENTEGVVTIEMFITDDVIIDGVKFVCE